MLRWGPAIQPKPLPQALRAYQSALEPRALLIPRDGLNRLLHIQKLLLRALQGLLETEETADFLEISGKARDQLRWAASRPLRLGCLRPDFVLDPDGRPWICEINARFAVNGFLCSAYVSDQFAQALPAFDPPCDGDRIRQALQLPPGSLIVKRREPGWDIHQLSQESCAPIVAELPTQAAEVVLELHQDELLQLDRLPSMPYWNDLRTQWLGHDKRLLQRLGDPGITERWLGREAELLASAIVPTRGVSPEAPQSSVLKPNRSGKGEGLVFGDELSEEEWRQRLAAAPSQWVVQPVVESALLEGQRLVGTLLSRDQQSLGLGIFRASAERVVNVSGGGKVLFPMCDGA